MRDISEPVYWGDNLSHEMCPCKRLCGSEGSYVCTTSLDCPAFRKWKSAEMDAIKKDFYKATGKRM